MLVCLQHAWWKGHMFFEMRLFIGCCVNQEHCWTCHFLLSWQALLENGRMLLFIHAQSTARGVCQTRSTMHKLVTFVQLVLYWYNGFSQSVVMASDLFLRISVWENRDTCHNIVRRQIASTLKKGWLLTYGYLLWYHNNKPFFFLQTPDYHPQISIWLKWEIF